MAEEKKQAKGTASKEFPPQIFAEDMAEDWSKDAVKIARYVEFVSTLFPYFFPFFLPTTPGLILSFIHREAFALTITSGDVHASIADFIRKKFDRDHDPGWNCVVGRSFGAYVTHEIKTYIYFTVHPGTYILLWRS